MKDSRLNIRCEENIYDEYTEICFFEKKSYGELLNELLELRRKSKNEKTKGDQFV